MGWYDTRRDGIVWDISLLVDIRQYVHLRAVVAMLLHETVAWERKRPTCSLSVVGQTHGYGNLGPRSS